MIRRLRLARCWAFGHSWTRWTDFVDAVHQRSRTRCPALEIQRDGEEGVIHA